MRSVSLLKLDFKISLNLTIGYTVIELEGKFRYYTYLAIPTGYLNNSDLSVHTLEPEAFK